MLKVHHSNSNTNNIMRTGLFWIFRHQKTILVITGVTLILSVIGISKVRVNHVLLEDLNDKVKIKRDFNFFDTNYSGVRPFEMQVTVADSSYRIWDYEVLREIDKVDRFIKAEYGAGFLFSPASFVKEIYQSSVNNAGGDFPPKDEAGEYIDLLKENRNSREVKRIVRQDGITARITAKIQDIGSEKMGEHNKKLKNFLETGVRPGLLQFKLTGAAELMDLNNDYMVKNMTQGFLFSILVIALLTFMLHKSWRMVLVFMLPNIIPLIIIAGIMGYAGIELKAATSLVFSIAFGIATDDTIHFISRLKIELSYGKSLLYAFKRTYFETGRPILLTTFILVGGFMSLMLSDFQSTFYFGFLICITIIVAVIADLFLLPVLLFMVYRKK
jgi:predicted RND superfamily exporter protein